MDMLPVALNRDDIAKFAKDPRTIRALENLNLNQDTAATILDGIIAAPLVGLVLSDVLENDRYLADSGNIMLSDGGAKNALSFDLTDLGTAGDYGSAMETVSVTVDEKGRVTGVMTFPLNSDNITEGGVNLFFTQARARASISATNINYDNTTGVLELTAANIAAATGATPAPDGTYANPASITIVKGIITAIS